MKLLPDTHLLIWLAMDSPRLTEDAKTLLLDPANEIFFSAASVWEVAIKFTLGRSPEFTLPPEDLRNGMLLHGLRELRVSSEHAMAIRSLPSTHGDPFDRLLVAQAMIEGLTLLTGDATLSTYPGTQLV